MPFVRPVSGQHQTIRLYFRNAFWVSSDWGLTWSRELNLALYGLYDFIADPKLYRHPLASNVIFVLHKYDATMRSTDSGSTWQRTMFTRELPCSLIEFVGNEPDSMIALAGDSVLRSNDTGATFTYSHPLGTFNNKQVRRIVIDRSFPSRWYGTIDFDGIVISTDQGRTWQRRMGSVANTATEIFQSKVDPRILWATGDQSITVSTNHGESWANVVNEARRYTLSSFALNGNNLIHSHCGVLFERSPYDGKSIILSKQIDQRHVGDLSIGKGPSMIAESYGQIFVRPEDSEKWKRVLEFEFRRDSVVDKVHVVSDPFVSGRYYVFSGNRYYWSTDGGDLWQSGQVPDKIQRIMFTESTNLMFAGPIGYITVAPSMDFRPNTTSISGLTTGVVSSKNSRYVLAVVATDVFGSQNSGQSWTKIGRLPVSIQNVVDDPVRAGVFYADMQGGFLRINVRDNSITTTGYSMSLNGATSIAIDSSIYAMSSSGKVLRLNTNSMNIEVYCDALEFVTPLSRTRPSFTSDDNEIFAWSEAGLHKLTVLPTSVLPTPTTTKKNSALYPIPAVSFIYVDVSECSLDRDQLVAYDALGNHFILSVLNRANGHIDVEFLPPGLYTIVYSSSSQPKAVTFIKSHH